jgi:hypothetical protein
MYGDSLLTAGVTHVLESSVLKRMFELERERER